MNLKAEEISLNTSKRQLLGSVIIHPRPASDPAGQTLERCIAKASRTSNVLISENDVWMIWWTTLQRTTCCWPCFLAPDRRFRRGSLINALSRRGQNRKPGHLLTNPLAEAHSDDRRHTIFISFFTFSDWRLTDDLWWWLVNMSENRTIPSIESCGVGPG